MEALILPALLVHLERPIPEAAEVAAGQLRQIPAAPVS
jgi:hypothetical protein